MPLLVRDDQELLIWRDEHDDISNLRAIQKLVDGYNPDMIVLEGCCDESTMKIYGKWPYNLYLKSMKHVLSRIVPSSLSLKVGPMMHGMADALFVRRGEVQSGAFANHGIIQYLMDRDGDEHRKQPLVIFGDLSLDICGVLMVMARYLDSYQLPMLLELLREIEGDGAAPTISNAMTKSEVNFEWMYTKLLSMDGGRDGVLRDILCEFLSPHRTVVANYRNYFLSLAINEAVHAMQGGEGAECKVLAVMGEGHVHDVIHKLENIGEGAMVNPFKEITDKRVLLKPSVPIKSQIGFDRKMTEKEQEFVRREFGDGLLNVFINKLQSARHLKQY